MDKLGASVALNIEDDAEAEIRIYEVKMFSNFKKMPEQQFKHVCS